MTAKYICSECSRVFHLEESFMNHARSTGHSWEEEDPAKENAFWEAHYTAADPVVGTSQ